MTEHQHAPVGGRLWSPWFFILLSIMAIAGVVLLQRFIFGLGAMTNLSDGYPWGIWIAIDLIIGTGLGCGGFVIAFLVYIMKRGEYHPLARAALLTSIFGYSLGAFAVMADLGRWWQGYNILFPWLSNPNSVLLETALCIFAYIVILLVEFTPTIFEHFGLTEARRRLHRVLFIFTGIGILLPMMHQSSMGTVVILLGYKLSPLWQSQLLTLFFLLSAITFGFAVVTLESLVASLVFDRPYDMSALTPLCGIMVWVMAAFFGLRVIDLTRLMAWPAAFVSSPMTFSFWVEMICGALAVALLLPKRNRRVPRIVFLAASAMLVTGVLYRLNCYLIGYDPGNGWHYFPSVGEILVTLGIFAAHFALYLVFVRYFPVLHATSISARPTSSAFAQHASS